MQTYKTKYAMVTTMGDFYCYFTNDQYIIQDIHFPNDNIAQIYYSDKAELHQSSKDSNIVIGCFVTAYGRMQLYEPIHKLGERVLYFDTDSITFISKANQYETQLGDYLGKFTNEIKQKDGDYIQTFVSAGPKNCAYKTNTC